MTHFKAALLAGATAMWAMTAQAAVLQFATSSSDSLYWTGSLFNAGTNGVSTASSSAFVSTIGSQAGNVPTAFLRIGNGNGVATTGLRTGGQCYSGTTCFRTTADTTISYAFAQPISYLGVNGVQNILTFTLARNSEIVFTTNRTGTVTGISISWAFSATDLRSPTSDVFKFGSYAPGSTNDFTVTYSFPQFTANANGIANGFQAVGSGTFASDPLPTIPEAPSAALLIAGLASVAYASRRRGA